MALCLFVLPLDAMAVTHLTRGAKAPDIVANDQNGNEIDTASMRGRILVVLFGELYHEKTLEACRLVHRATQDQRLAGDPVVILLVTMQPLRPEEMEAHAQLNLAAVLNDAGRRAFGAYRVAVMPSVVVVDSRGRVVHAVAGLTDRLEDRVTDALLLAAGRLSEEQFELALHPRPDMDVAESLRVERTAMLAGQLARRGLDELAADKYLEVLEMDPQHVPARLGLGMLLLRRGRLPDAEAQFRAVLSEKPESVQASLGLAFVQTLRSGDELDEAQQTVAAVLRSRPMEPRAHYLQGLIYEKRDRTEAAAASFKRAAQLLLERGQSEQEQ